MKTCYGEDEIGYIRSMVASHIHKDYPPSLVQLWIGRRRLDFGQLSDYNKKNEVNIDVVEFFGNGGVASTADVETRMDHLERRLIDTNVILRSDHTMLNVIDNRLDEQMRLIENAAELFYVDQRHQALEEADEEINDRIDHHHDRLTRLERPETLDLGSVHGTDHITNGAAAALSITTMQQFFGLEQTVSRTYARMLAQQRYYHELSSRVAELEASHDLLNQSNSTLEDAIRARGQMLWQQEGRIAQLSMRLDIIERRSSSSSTDEPPATRRRTLPPTFAASHALATVTGTFPSAVAGGGEGDSDDDGVDLSGDVSPHDVHVIADRIERFRGLDGGSHQFFVKTLTGKTITLTTDNGIESFSTIIMKIASKFRLLEGEEIRLIYEGRNIYQATRSFHIKEGTTVYMIMRLRGGGDVGVEGGHTLTNRTGIHVFRVSFVIGLAT